MALKGPNYTMAKNPDNYNIDIVKHITKVMNDGTLMPEQKMDRLKVIVDTVYLDGHKHGYAEIKQEERENAGVRGKLSEWVKNENAITRMMKADKLRRMEL